MRKMRTKLLSYVLVVLMIISLVPAAVFAEEESMSEEFKSILNENGEFEMYSVVPKSEDDIMSFFWDSEKMRDEYPKYDFSEFSEDFKSCVITDMFTEESHRVDIKYIYDEAVIPIVDDIIKSLPEGEDGRGYYFSVKDMELFNWWINGGETLTMVDYSGELKGYLNYKNFVIDCRMGMDSEFYTNTYGEAPFSYAGTVYDVIGMGVQANHVFYVPDGTETTKEALMAAVQKRFDEYAGEGVAKVTYGGQGIRQFYIDLYDAMLEEAEADLVECEEEIARYEALIEEEYTKCNNYQTEIVNCYTEIDMINDFINEKRDEQNDRPERYDEIQAEIDALNEEIINKNSTIGTLAVKRDEALTKVDEYNYTLSKIRLEKMNYESEVGNVAGYKEYALASYDEEGGEFYFLQKAAGDYWFNLQIGEATYMFIVVVDSDGMINPECRTSDVATDISVATGDTSVPLDTRISVEKLTGGEVYDKIIKTLNVNDNLTFDINLYSDSLEKNITKLSNGKFEVRIPVGEKFKDKDLVVYYVNEKLQVKEYAVIVKDGYASFETDHFSIYTLAEQPSTNVTPGDNANVYIWVGLLGIGTLVAYKTRRKTIED